jgi:hypothetical protein
MSQENKITKLEELSIVKSHGIVWNLIAICGVFQKYKSIISPYFYIEVSPSEIGGGKCCV